MGARRPCRAASRVLRRAGLPLRHPPAVVPEASEARAGGRGARRASVGDRRVRRHRRRSGGAAGHHPRARHSGGHRHDRRPAMSLVDRFAEGLDAPICLTWELTYACNLACVHCLSSSGRRDPRELSTAECKALIDEFERMQIFYVNIGGGEPTVRPDFWELVDYATAHHVGIKFSTNGVKITPEVAARLAVSDYVDVQISLDGATAEVNDAVRGVGSSGT